MPCFHPLTGYRQPSGKIKFLGSSPKAFSLTVTVACGQCRGCRLERSRQWAVRCTHEAQMHERNSFITLSYEDPQLPVDLGLRPKHLQSFWKRLRRRTGKLRYYACGEYGDETKRPHYHACIFGQDYQADRVFQSRNQQGDALYSSELLTDIWGHGHVWIGDFSFQTAAYVARYVIKKQNGPKRLDAYSSVDTSTGEVTQLAPPFTTMSGKPGIGKTWLDRYYSDVYPRDEVAINGHLTRPPKYYDRQVDELLLEQLKLQREAAGKLHSKDQTPERLAVREECLIRKTASLHRSL